jgi:glucose dehydrogenase
MRPYVPGHQYDVVIIGSGVAGALAAYRLAKAKKKVLIVEAGGIAPESLGRWTMVQNYIASSAKAPDSPFCGEDILPVDPKIDTTKQPAPYRFVQPNALNGANYYYYAPGTPNPANPNQFKSYYERVVGGSTWHWQAIYVRMLPSDFQMEKLYHVGKNWPISYKDIEPWYVDAEYEMGVAGSDQESKGYYERLFHAYRSKPYPMPALAASYLDKQVAAAIDGASLRDFPGQRLKVNTVPHAINSIERQNRPACDGHTSCVPLCPTKARYEAIIHVEKALKEGAKLLTQCVVTKLEFEENNKSVKRVIYRRWDGEEDWVSGRIVVLAANGIENPRILLSSGVTNDAVGRHLMDHPIKQSYALAKKPLFPYRGPQTTSDISVFRDGPFRSEFAGFKTSIKNDGWSSVGNTITAPRGASIPGPHPDKPNQYGTILDFVENQKQFGADLRMTLHEHATHQITLNSACEQLPLPENRVTLAPPDQLDGYGIPRPQITYSLYDPQNYVSKSFDTILKLHEFVFNKLGIPSGDQFLQKEPGIYGGSGHIMGTTIMGDDAKSSVVNKDCRAHDYANLYILGSSVFPTSSTANPTSTIAALSLRAADAINKELGG